MFNGVLKKKLCVFHHLETVDEVGGEGGCSCFSRQEEMQTMESLNIIQTVGKNVIKDSTLSHRQQYATVNTSKGKKKVILPTHPLDYFNFFFFFGELQTENEGDSVWKINKKALKH